jgi:hypothetical protein
MLPPLSKFAVKISTLVKQQPLLLKRLNNGVCLLYQYREQQRLQESPRDHLEEYQEPKRQS